MIKNVGGKFRLVSHTGRNLGTFSSKKQAKEREAQVNFFKHLDSIPKSALRKPSLKKRK